MPVIARLERSQLTLTQRIELLDWPEANAELDAYGAAAVGPLLSPEECDTLARRYDDDQLYRSRVVMARHGFGRGTYKYYKYPLPSIVTELRMGLYPPLARIANRWNESMGVDVRYPPDHEAFKARCHEAGQTKPTPLILKYEAGDFNCLHQDIYGEHVFPLQVAFLLSEPGTAFTGGEFTLLSSVRACSHERRSYRCGRAWA